MLYHYTIAVLSLTLTLTACQQPVAITYSPTVDMKGVNLDKYSADLSECYEYGKQVPDNSVAQGLFMAAAGAGIGAAVGHEYGMTGRGASYGASLGAATGSIRGYSSYRDRVKEVVDNCLKGRGYKVL